MSGHTSMLMSANGLEIQIHELPTRGGGGRTPII